MLSRRFILYDRLHRWAVHFLATSSVILFGLTVYKVITYRGALKRLLENQN